MPGAGALYAVVVISAVLRALWAEPRVPAPAGTPWWDRALVAVLVPATLVEGLVRDDVPWPPWSIGLALVCVVALLWRRSHPLAATVVAFSAQTAAGMGPDLAGLDYGVLNTTACVLAFPYSLCRWASGRGAVVGVAVVLAEHLVREPLYGNPASEIVVGAGFLLFPAALGAAVRFQATARRRQADQVRTHEREQLARELHDTVAHHVSGIVIQAQAGQAVAAADPDRAVEVLGTIEAAATRSLAEMRAIVGLLRDGADAERAPAPGIADLEHLVEDLPDGPAVDLVVDGDVASVSTAVGTAAYRVVQESVTNARRHARGARHIGVRVVGEDGAVRITVVDDGRTAGDERGEGGGYGLAGMAERVGCWGAPSRRARGPRAAGP